MSQLTRFIILAAPRTGSNLLCTLLNSHPDVLCHHELFNPRGIYYALDHRDGSLDFGSLETRDREPDAFLQRVWTHPLGAACVGFKMTRGQDAAIMQEMTGDSGVLKIVLHRRNRLKTYVSEQLARRSDTWEVYAPEQRATGVPRLQIDADAFRAHVADNDRFYRDLRHVLTSGRQPWIETAYEALFSAAEQRRLLEFLGVEASGAALVEASIKQNDSDLRSHIANFEELESALAGSEYLAQLHDRRH
ncbi:MAG: hypothetical protein R3F42_00095 [Pseudomonadota bacterium]